METPQEQINQLAQEIIAHNVTPELNAQANLVMGDGNPSSGVVFIGEAPGATEDAQGKPFVGDAGQVLNEGLQSVGITREDDVYITNVVKYRPPGNIDPTAAQKKAFMPYLEKELNILKPNIIVALGNHSLSYFTGKSGGITKVHGQPQKVVVNGREVILLPMLHPSYTLMSRSKREPFMEDFKVLKQLIDETKENDTP